jgi:hypothetical protein
MKDLTSETLFYTRNISEKNMEQNLATSNSWSSIARRNIPQSVLEDNINLLSNSDEVVARINEESKIEGENKLDFSERGLQRLERKKKKEMKRECQYFHAHD